MSRTQQFRRPMGGAAATIAYLLRDEFTTALAAGSVNGTAAVPGPGGNREVTDTNSKLSIATGRLSLATGSASGDRLEYSETFARVAGRFVIGNINISALQDTIFGFNVSSANNESAFRLVGTGVICRDGGGAQPVIAAAVSTSTNYYLCVVLKTAGNYYFIKGGAYTYWTLLYSSPTATQTNIKVGYRSGNSALVFTADYVRVPVATWLPTPLAYDTFTRADGVLGNSETTGPDSQAVAARAWTAQAGTWGVATNVAACSALAGGIGIATVPAGSINVLCSAAATRSGDNVGIVLRYQGASDYVIAYHDGTNAKLDKVTTAGGTTNVISAAAAYAAGAIIWVVADGTSFALYYNNAKIGNTSTISDATLQTGTAHGLYTTNTGNTLDTFQCFARGSGNEYAALDGF